MLWSYLFAITFFRVHGEKVAEVPLVGTRLQYRGQGMCRILMDELEKVIHKPHIFPSYCLFTLFGSPFLARNKWYSNCSVPFSEGTQTKLSPVLIKFIVSNCGIYTAATHNCNKSVFFGNNSIAQDYFTQKL